MACHIINTEQLRVAKLSFNGNQKPKSRMQVHAAFWITREMNVMRVKVFLICNYYFQG